MPQITWLQVMDQFEKQMLLSKAQDLASMQHKHELEYHTQVGTRYPLGGTRVCFFFFNNYKKGIKFTFFQRFSYIVLRNTIVLPIRGTIKVF